MGFNIFDEIGKSFDTALKLIDECFKNGYIYYAIGLVGFIGIYIIIFA